MHKVFKYTLIDLVRNRFVLGFGLLLFTAAQGLFLLEPEPIEALLSLVQVVLALVPLVALVFTVVYVHDTMDFIQLLAVQPLARRSILGGQMAALGTALLLAVGLGLGLPIVAHLPNKAGAVLLVSAGALALVFTVLGMLIAWSQREKARGVGLGLLTWFLFVFVYDAVLFWLMFALSDWPLEPFVVPIASVNPIDLARIMVMLEVDLAAMMGYSGAVYKQFFGGSGGMVVAGLVLLLWMGVPAWATLRKFIKRDL